jgi:hypothetical protein
MPRLTRYFIKTALIYLALSLVLGAVLAAQSALALPDGRCFFARVLSLVHGRLGDAVDLWHVILDAPGTPRNCRAATRKLRGPLTG